MSTAPGFKLAGFIWHVEVWFTTSRGYNVVAEGLNREDALKRAREYWSDSRGIKIVNIYGSFEQVKGEAS